VKGDRTGAAAVVRCHTACFDDDAGEFRIFDV
jgi:hypothetical protein